MKYFLSLVFKVFFVFLVFCFLTPAAYAQTGTPTNQMGTQKKDTTHNKTNTNKWKNERANVSYQKLNSEIVYYPDTSLHSFHGVPYLKTWDRDLSNLGSPVTNLLFTPMDRFGPTLGYHVYDAEKYLLDSLKYYNTNRPYSEFNYRLGYNLEQIVDIMHTQNVKPNWNVAIGLKNTSSPGNYKIQRNDNYNAYLTSKYRGLKKHYTLNLALVYNLMQHDENGGLSIPHEFDSTDEKGNKIYGDKSTMDVINQKDAYSIVRSSVFNNQQELSFLLQHSYIFGHTDTTYNSDSTQYTFKLKPWFSLTHKLAISVEKHIYNDLVPDSLRYIKLFNASFTNSGTGYYTQGGDSVFSQQGWYWVDNKLMLNGYLGNQEDPLKFSAGIGNRYDQFSATPTQDWQNNKLTMIHNYIEGSILKEALQMGQWAYGASSKLFVSGTDAGDFYIKASLGKQFKNFGFLVGAQEQVNTAPYSFSYYKNLYATDTFPTANKESVTTIYATIESAKLKFTAGLRNYVIGNYIYIDSSEKPIQYGQPFSLMQAWIKKDFRLGSFHLDNQIAIQQTAADAPVNVPFLMGRHQLSYENAILKKTLQVAIGLEVRYNTPYKPAGYSFLLNQFFYQNSTSSVSNFPEMAFFVNFKVKNRFRAFIMVDQLQQMISSIDNPIYYVGNPPANSTITPVYAGQNILMRAGFSWVLVN